MKPNQSILSVEEKKYRYKIGIDPGIKSGFAIWDGDEKNFIIIKTFPLHEVFHTLSFNNKLVGETIIYIENPNTWVPFKRLSPDILELRKQGAGAVKQTFKHIIEFLEDHNIPYKTTRLQGGLKKKSAQWFKEQTKWEGRTDEHGRDAALIVWGR